jgi:hypothetical protein
LGFSGFYSLGFSGFSDFGLRAAVSSAILSFFPLDAVAVSKL